MHNVFIWLKTLELRILRISKFFYVYNKILFFIPFLNKKITSIPGISKTQAINALKRMINAKSVFNALHVL